jgi:hypothetical protein
MLTRKTTRSHRRSVGRSYRRHRGATRCHGKTHKQCKKAARCKYVKSKQGSFCRKRHNKHTQRYRKYRNKGMRGGSIMTSALGAARQALLPFLMYSAQKRVQRRSKTRRRRSRK